MARRTILLVAALLTLAGCGPSANEEKAAILQVMHREYDRPEARLDAGPVAVDGAHAVVDWTQGDMGGRALLEKRGNQWAIRLCGGEPLRTAEGLMKSGLTPNVAEALAQQLAEAEREVAPDRLDRMRQFRGIVRM